jgi:predicted RNA-binding Zn-ribbon protein involved in translation (DUF1610 family)
VRISSRKTELWVATVEDCKHCGQSAVHDFETRNNSTEIHCPNCGLYLYNGPNFREDCTIVPEEWIFEEAIPTLGHSLPEVFYWLGKAGEPEYWVKKLREHEQDLEYARILVWKPETRTNEVLYQFGEVPECWPCQSQEANEADIPY